MNTYAYVNTPGNISLEDPMKLSPVVAAKLGLRRVVCSEELITYNLTAAKDGGVPPALRQKILGLAEQFKMQDTPEYKLLKRG